MYTNERSIFRQISWRILAALQWRHNERDGYSNHQPCDYLLNRLFRRRSKKTSAFRLTCLCEGNPPMTDGSPHKRPVTRKMLPFDMASSWRVFLAAFNAPRVDRKFLVHGRLTVFRVAIGIRSIHNAACQTIIMCVKGQKTWKNPRWPLISHFISVNVS